jgi:hydrogenase expression/formation protein HypC
MCLAVPARITRLDDSGQGTVDHMGSEVKVHFALLPKAKRGDWVIVHAGFAISLLDEGEALETLRLFKEMDDASRR